MALWLLSDLSLNNIKGKQALRGPLLRGRVFSRLLTFVVIIDYDSCMSEFNETFSSELGEVPSEDKDSQNILSQLRAIVQEEVLLPEVEIEVKQRPGVSVVYSPNISNAQLKSWRKKSTNRKTGELDDIKFACLVVGDTAEEIHLNGEPATLEDGSPLRFNTQEFADMMDVEMFEIVPHGIRDFFGVDAHLSATAMLILDNSGYGDEVETEEDPTSGS